MKLIGNGSYANVYKYKDTFYNRPFILKRAKKELTDKEIARFKREFSVFDKGIITRHLKNGANLHETATIGETQSGGFFCDMAGVHWGPPCFGYQGGPQQTPAIPAEKSNYCHSNFETKCPKAIVVPAHFYIGALVVYPPSPPTIKHRREQAVKGA